MEAKTTTFTAMQWARHEKFVEMLRVVKQRKRERQTQIEMRLKEEAEYVRKERQTGCYLQGLRRGNSHVPRQQTAVAPSPTQKLKYYPPRFRKESRRFAF